MSSTGSAPRQRSSRVVLLVAGISLRNLVPRFWDRTSPYYVSGITAVMVSFTDLVQMPSHFEAVCAKGLRAHLGLPEHYKVFLDNGAFHTLSHNLRFDSRRYKRVVDAIKPDWYPIPIEHIPHPSMTAKAQARLYRLTMAQNRKYIRTSFAPVVHVGACLPQFLDGLEKLATPIHKLGLGAMVPFLLRSRGADCRTKVVDDVLTVRRRFPKTRIHGFGIGGTATLHVATVLGLDSVDSSGWRNRAARGIVQLVGTGDRVVADFGKWRGRRLSPKERASLRDCGCGSCSTFGPKELEKDGLRGFGARASHNLWVLVQELREAEARVSAPGYLAWVQAHLDNRVFLPLLQHALRETGAAEARQTA